MSNLLNPEISVVVVVLTGHETCLSRCLSSLTSQLGSTKPEVIVPCDETSSHLCELRNQFPSVRFVQVTGKRTYAELRTIGVRESKGRIVALTEDHCSPAPDWCYEILLAHQRANVAIGGAVDKDSADTALNWAFYLADYCRYMNPVPEGQTNHLTDCNVSYKRSALDTIVDVWRNEFHEPEVHAALIDKGDSLFLSSRIVVSQQRSLSVRKALKDRYVFGRLFAATRCQGFSARQRCFFAASSALLPPLLVARVAGHVNRTKRCTKQFFIALPQLILISTVWATGEFVGYVTKHAERSLTP